MFLLLYDIHQRYTFKKYSNLQFLV